MTFPFPDDSPVILVLSFCFFFYHYLERHYLFFQFFSQSLCDSERTLNELRGARPHARRKDIALRLMELEKGRDASQSEQFNDQLVASPSVHQ